MERTDDNTAIGRVLSGDTDAFSVLVDKYSRPAFSLILRICGNREAAEELTQDTFMKAYTNLKKFRGNSSFPTWLYRIAYNTAVSHTRKKVREQNVDSWDNITEPGNGPLYNDGADTEDMRRMSDIMEKALNLLTPDEKTVVTLFYKQDMKLKDIAVIMSLSEGNTRTKLFRTRRKLASIYKILEEKE